MARIVKPDEYATKRKEILDAALRQMMTRGFGNVVVRDILIELNISSGAFHHYFDSRDALLEALISQIVQETEEPILAIIRDPQQSAIQKLQGFFGTLDSMRIVHRADVIRIWRVWYSDENAVVRQKMNELVLERRATLINEIVRQGVQEKVFSIAYPEQAGEIILSMVQGMGNTHARLLFEAMRESDERVAALVDCIVTTHAAYMDAIEHVLGAPVNCLYRTNAEEVMEWVTALKSDDQGKLRK